MSKAAGCADGGKDDHRDTNLSNTIDTKVSSIAAHDSDSDEFRSSECVNIGSWYEGREEEEGGRRENAVDVSGSDRESPCCLVPHGVDTLALSLNPVIRRSSFGSVSSETRDVIPSTRVVNSVDNNHEHDQTMAMGSSSPSSELNPSNRHNSNNTNNLSKCIMAHLTVCNAAMEGIMLSPQTMQHMNGVITALRSALARDGDTNGMRGEGDDPVSRLMLGVVKEQTLGTSVRKIRTIGVFLVVVMLCALLRKKLRSLTFVSVLVSAIGAAFGALRVARNNIRWILSSPSPARPSPFSMACRCIVLLKSTQSQLLEARIACSRHHITNSVGADILSTQQESLCRALLTNSVLFPFQSTRTTGAKKGDDSGAWSAEEVEVLIARCQRMLWTRVKSMALLCNDSSYSATFSDAYRMFSGIRHLKAHLSDLERLHTRLGEFESGSTECCDRTDSPVDKSTFQAVMGVQELYAHAQRLSGQLYLYRLACASDDNMSEEEREQGMRDVTDSMSALISAWQRVNSRYYGGPNAHYASRQHVMSEGKLYAHDDGSAVDSGSLRQGTDGLTSHASELTGQGEDPVPLFPDDSYDEDVGVNRAALPDNFAEMLLAMKRGR